ncbi:MAG: hypothetical protein C5B50_05965 [Verrucomicrobia bacterium]|nr:MAG: hypothetical protein C5B50_05965 [Verrucomicrobiota bacterium]
MNTTEEAILNVLLELETAAKNSSSGGHKYDFQQLFARLEDLAGRLPKGSDPMLRHYLDNKSYQKARLLLQGREEENARGSCG